MDNSAALRIGSARAKKIIQGHMTVILRNALDELVDTAMHIRRELTGHNMTGNTVNSYAGGLFIDGALKAMSLGQPGKSPLRNKLRGGEKFSKGKRRWDGKTQEHTFTAPIDTDGRTEAAASIDFIKSYKPKSKGLEIVVCDGVEYGTYQENEMGIDVLTGSFSGVASILANSFFPLPD